METIRTAIVTVPLMHKLTALVLFSWLAKESLAQSIPADTAVYRQGIEAAVASYHQAMGTQAGLYNGIEHVRYLPIIIGIPYYQVDDWQNATIEYNSILYKDVPVRYDLVKDQLIVSHPNGYQSFYLFTPWVKSFTLGGSLFVNLPKDSAGGAPAPGFYQVLHRGPLTVLAKRSRKIQQRSTDARLEFVTTDKYYILKEGIYYAIRNQADLLTLVGDRKGEARKALRQQGIRFRSLPEAAILTVAEFYNQ
jgi:hypothetical protein